MKEDEEEEEEESIAVYSKLRMDTTDAYRWPINMDDNLLVGGREKNPQ